MAIPPISGPSSFYPNQSIDWNKVSTLLENTNNILSDNMAVTDQVKQNFDNFVSLYKENLLAFTPDQKVTIDRLIDLFNSLPFNQPLASTTLLSVQASIAKVENSCDL
jgi:hypothetical protein